MDDADTTPQAVDHHVGRRLRAIRIFRGLSQGQLAEALGLTFQQVQKYERGVNRVSASKLYAAAQALGVSPNALFDGLELAGPDADAEAAAAPITIDVQAARLYLAYEGLPANARKALVKVAEELAEAFAARGEVEGPVAVVLSEAA